MHEWPLAGEEASREAAQQAAGGRNQTQNVVAVVRELLVRKRKGLLRSSHENGAVRDDRRRAADHRE
jgi:hypothetical protein